MQPTTDSKPPHSVKSIGQKEEPGESPHQDKKGESQMVDTERILEEMGECGLGIRDFAREMGMSPRTVEKRLKDGRWSTDEIERARDVLQLTEHEAVAIFFSEKDKAPEKPCYMGRLRDLIGESGHTQEEIAKRAGLKPSDFMRKLAQGMFSRKEAAQIAKVLGIPKGYPTDVVFFDSSTVGRISLKEARERAGLSQVQAAKRVGISERTLREWEHGRISPTGDGFKRLCDCYHVSVGDVSYQTPGPEPIERKEAHLYGARAEYLVRDRIPNYDFIMVTESTPSAAEASSGAMGILEICFYKDGKFVGRELQSYPLEKA